MLTRFEVANCKGFKDKIVRDLNTVREYSFSTEIYTNAMTSAHKNIGRFHLTRVNPEFTDSIVNLVVLLESIRDGYPMQKSVANSGALFLFIPCGIILSDYTKMFTKNYCKYSRVIV